MGATLLPLLLLVAAAGAMSSSFLSEELPRRVADVPALGMMDIPRDTGAIDKDRDGQRGERI